MMTVQARRNNRRACSFPRRRRAFHVLTGQAVISLLIFFGEGLTTPIRISS